MNNSTKITAFGGATFRETSCNLTQLNQSEVFQCLESILGPQQMQNHLVLVLVTIFYVLLFLGGVIGNLLVCVVIIKSKELHSAMNYYLLSLAVADLTLITTGLPNELEIYWHQYPYPFSEAFCKLRSFISESASYANVLTILSFSLERYLVICKPMNLSILPFSDLTRATLVIAICWVVAIIAAVPYLLSTRVIYLLHEDISIPQSAFCTMSEENIYPQGYPVHELSFVVFFLVPILLLTFLYISMVQTILMTRGKNNSLIKHAGTGSSITIADNRNHIICMLIAVIVSFFISWAPFHIQRLGYVYFTHSYVYRTVNEYLMYLSGFFYYLSATLNPILYNLMSVKYRHAFITVILCKQQQNPKALVQATCQIHLHLRDFYSQATSDPLNNARSPSEVPQRNKDAIF